MGVAFHERAECHVSGWPSFVWLRSPGEPTRRRTPPGPEGEKRYQVEGSPVGEGREKGFYICREEGKGT